MSKKNWVDKDGAIGDFSRWTKDFMTFDFFLKKDDVKGLRDHKKKKKEYKRKYEKDDFWN